MGHRSVAGVDHRKDVHDFLASRRARLTPAQAGLPERAWQAQISPDRLNHPRPGAQYNLMAEYSYLVLYLPRGTSRDAARRILTDHAEYGDWELARLRLNADGSRKATLRRQVIRGVRTRYDPARRVSIPGPVTKSRP